MLVCVQMCILDRCSFLTSGDIFVLFSGLHSALSFPGTLVVINLRPCISIPSYAVTSYLGPIDGTRRQWRLLIPRQLIQWNSNIWRQLATVQYTLNDGRIAGPAARTSTLNFSL